MDRGFEGGKVKNYGVEITVPGQRLSFRNFKVFHLCPGTVCIIPTPYFLTFPPQTPCPFSTPGLVFRALWSMVGQMDTRGLMSSRGPLEQESGCV